jgi:perosamine synthetase
MTDYAENIYWVYGIVINENKGMNAEQAIKKLNEKGIGCRPFFYPMHKQPVFNKAGLFVNDQHPNSIHLAENGFYIPSGLALTKEQAVEVANAMKEIFV